MEKIRLGIVGFGFMGHNDADMMATFDDIDLIAVADTTATASTAAIAVLIVLFILITSN